MDILTGAVVTLVIAALVASVSSGVTQAGRVLDQRAQDRMLHLAGAEVGVLQRAQLRETWLPLTASVIIAAGTAMIMIVPVSAMAGPRTLPGLVMFAVTVMVAVAMVMLAVRLTQPLVAAAALDELSAAR